MERNNLIIPASIFLALFVIWFIFYANSPGIEKDEKKEDEKIEEEAPWRRERRDLDNNYEFDHENDSDYRPGDNFLDYEIDFDFDFGPPEGEDIQYQNDFNFDFQKQPDSSQGKVNECLMSEERRYNNILNTFLNSESFFYVGNEDFFDYWEFYKQEYQERKLKCYQLY